MFKTDFWPRNQNVTGSIVEVELHGRTFAIATMAFGRIDGRVLPAQAPEDLSRFGECPPQFLANSAGVQPEVWVARILRLESGIHDRPGSLIRNWRKAIELFPETIDPATGAIVPPPAWFERTLRELRGAYFRSLEYVVQSLGRARVDTLIRSQPDHPLLMRPIERRSALACA